MDPTHRQSHRPIAEARDPAHAHDPVHAYGRMTSALVHDLRTPLTSIVGAASTLQSYAERLDGETRDKLLQSIVDEAGHLDRMLANLSVLARAQSGTLTLHKQSLQASELLNGVVAKARQRNGGTADIRIVAGDAEAALELDAGLVQDALLNVLDIAARFAPPAAARELAAAPHDGRLGISVTTALAPASRDKLDALLTAFAAGARGDAARVSDFILLDAARQVVHIHQGDLTVETASGPDRFHAVLTLPI